MSLDCEERPLNADDINDSHASGTMDSLEARYLAARDALYANLNLQERLEDTMKQLEEGINSNETHKAKLHASALTANRIGWYSGLKAVKFGSRGRVGPQVVGPSQFWMSGAEVPEPNADTLKLLEAYSYLPHSFKTLRWSDEEDTKLKKLVLTTVKEAEIDAYQKSVIEAEQMVRESIVKQKEKQHNSIKLEDPGTEKVIMAFDKEKWHTIAMQHGNQRSGSDCQLRWKSFLQPSIRQSASGRSGEWTAEEDKRLRELAETFQEREWEKVSEELNTGRSAVCCLSRFRHLQFKQSDKAWSAEEVEQLKAAIEKHKYAQVMWKAVAGELKGRTSLQCNDYWRKYLRYGPKKSGKWSKEEDQALRNAVKVFGFEWKKIAKALPQRDGVSIRGRWVDILDPNLKKGLWSAEEDAIVVAAINDSKDADDFRWADLFKRLNRTTRQIRNRVALLRKRSLKKAAKSQAMEEQKAEREAKRLAKKSATKERRRVVAQEARKRQREADVEGHEPSTTKSQKINDAGGKQQHNASQPKQASFKPGTSEKAVATEDEPEISAAEGDEERAPRIPRRKASARQRTARKQAALKADENGQKSGQRKARARLQAKKAQLKKSPEDKAAPPEHTAVTVNDNAKIAQLLEVAEQASKAEIVAEPAGDSQVTTKDNSLQHSHSHADTLGAAAALMTFVSEPGEACSNE